VGSLNGKSTVQSRRPRSRGEPVSEIACS
jgi:hypothetical protein